MKKNLFKIFKISLAFSIVSAMSINTIAAVGANDGSAFITKAEFDALVNTFNEQMDNYESGIISKVDGAIANYLDSLSNERTVNVDSIINKLSRYDRTFLNNSNIDTSTAPKNGNTFLLNLCAFAVVSVTYYNTTVYASNTNEGYVRLNSYDYNSGAPSYTVVNNDADTNWKIKLREIEKNGAKYYAPTEDGKLFYIKHIINANGAVVNQNNNYANPANFPSIVNWEVESTAKNPGDGGNTNIAGNIWGSAPSMRIFHNHSIVSDDSAVYDFTRYLPGTSYIADIDKVWYGIVENNTDGYDSENYLEITAQGGSTNGPGCRYIQKPHEADKTSDLQTRKTDTFKYKFYTQEVISKNIYDWVNYSATDLYDEVVKKSDGIPVCTVKEKGKIVIPIDLTNSVGKSTIAIKKTRWGSTGPTESEKDGYVYYNSSAGDSFNITIAKNDTTKTTYWLKVNPNNPGATCEVSLDGNILHYIED